MSMIVHEPIECEVCRDCRSHPVGTGIAADYELCNSCFEEGHGQCTDCREWVRLYNYDDSTGLCDWCYREKYIDCRDCGKDFERTVMENDYCPDCRATYFHRLERDSGPRNIGWVDWADFAQLTRTIDYGCNFDCDGECSGTRNGEWHGSDGRGCCRDCGRERGYLDHLPVGSGDEVKALYDDELGFWRPGGCILPIEYRSNVCLTYSCCSQERKDHADENGMKLIPLQLEILDIGVRLAHPV